MNRVRKLLAVCRDTAVNTSVIDCQEHDVFWGIVANESWVKYDVTIVCNLNGVGKLFANFKLRFANGLFDSY